MKFYMIKHLILLKIQTMVNIKEVLPQWFFFDKKLEYTDKTSGGPIKNVIMSNQQLRNELHKTIENLKNVKYTHLLETLYKVTA